MARVAGPAAGTEDATGADIELPALALWLAPALGAVRVDIAAAGPLTGGAVNRNIALDVTVTGGRRAGVHGWVLRTGPPVASATLGLGRTVEFALLRVAFAAGVRVPEPIVCSDAGWPGPAFVIADRLPGTGEARRIVRDPALEAFGPALAASLGSELAKIHAIRPPRADLDIPGDPAAPALAEIARFRAGLDTAGAARPALEYALAWLAANAPAPNAVTLVHGDFRTGNYLVDGGRLTGILDWELAHWGDPREDIGWFAARCWRFGNDAKVAGGLARFSAFLDAYNAQAETKVAAAEIVYWEIFAAARWAAAAAMQGARGSRLPPGRASLELALTGLMAPEMEFDALAGIDAFEKGTR